ncbi:LemA family protein [archaeon]|nr:LemA family protein [archaeon]|tara:strand:- start:12 stop:593 length:582 start_codon:yes stop_codon:yes gene_type:complete
MALGIGVGVAIIIGVLILLVIIGFALYAIGVYNGLVRLKNNIKKSFANIDVLLKQRAAELPKLLASVKGYMKHEKDLLLGVTKARTAFLNAKTIGQKAAADNQLSGMLKSLFAVAENYPKLRANENFLHLQARISGIENELADRREFYNDSVNTYNIRIQSFPDMIVARMLGYRESDLFKASAEDKKDVKIEF